MSTYKSDFLNTLSTRGYIHQCSDATGLDELAAKGDVVTYIGFDCTAPSLHVGSLVQIMMLHWLQETGNKPIALMGGGTTRVGDPSGTDESRKLLTHRGDRGQQARHPAGLQQVPALRQGAERRHDGRQRRMADQAELHRLPARYRPAFLGQPHAGDGFGQAAAGARAGAVLPRIQLHDPAGLRLTSNWPGATAAACRWAARTSGATSSTASTWAGAWARTSSLR